MGEIIMMNWDLREFRVRVNIPFLIRQVLLLKRQVETPTQGLLNPIRHVVPLNSHIGSYPPYHSHLHRQSLFFYHHRRTQSYVIPHHLSMPWSRVNTEYSIHRVQHSPSTAYTEYSIHRVQHTPSTAYTEYSIHRVQHTPSKAYTKYSIYHRLSVFPPFSQLRFDPCMLSQLSVLLLTRSTVTSELSMSELRGKVTSSHSHSCELTKW